MPWVRLDEEFPDHPKVVTAGPLAGWLHVCALAYCNRHLTDGFVPRAQVARLANFDGVIALDDAADSEPCDVRDAPDVDPHALAATLVSLGMWESRQGGYLIHDFLDYQPSRAEIEAQRKVKKDAGRAGGIRSGESRRSRTEAEPKQPGSRPRSRTEAETEPDHEAKGEAKPKPDPDPDPDPLSSSSVLNHRVGPPASDDDDESRTLNRARSAIAERRIAALAKPPANPRAYRSSVLRDVDAEHGDDLRRLVGEGLGVEAIADALCPAPTPASTSPAHQRWEPSETDEPALDAEANRARLAEMSAGIGRRVG